MSRIRTILHPTDFSRASTAAFKRAVEMAKANRAGLFLVHVLAPTAPLMMADGDISPKVYEQIEAAGRAEAQKQMRKLGEQAKRSGVRAKALLLEGVPQSGLCRPRAQKRRMWS